MRLGIKIGGIDPVKLSEGIINVLIQKGVISSTEAQQIVDYSKQ